MSEYGETLKNAPRGAHDLTFNKRPWNVEGRVIFRKEHYEDFVLPLEESTHLMKILSEFAPSDIDEYDNVNEYDMEFEFPDDDDVIDDDRRKKRNLLKILPKMIHYYKKKEESIKNGKYHIPYTFESSDDEEFPSDMEEEIHWPDESNKDPIRYKIFNGRRVSKRAIRSLPRSFWPHSSFRMEDYGLDVKQMSQNLDKKFSRQLSLSSFGNEESAKHGEIYPTCASARYTDFSLKKKPPLMDKDKIFLVGKLTRQLILRR